jgi:hypothetical protein
MLHEAVDDENQIAMSRNSCRVGMSRQSTQKAGLNDLLLAVKQSTVAPVSPFETDASRMLDVLPFVSNAVVKPNVPKQTLKLFEPVLEVSESVPDGILSDRDFTAHADSVGSMNSSMKKHSPTERLQRR